MSNAKNLLVPLLLVCAVAGGVAWYLNQETQPAPTPEKPTIDVPVETPPEKPVVPSVATDQPQDPDRNAVNPNAAGDGNADAPQGVRGRVLLPNGQPAVGTPVYLLENALSNAIDMFISNKMGKVKPPIAASVTGADGVFMLGIRKSGMSVDLRVASDAYPEFQRQQIKVRDGDWYDAKDIQLEAGLVVSGRVIETHSKAAVANATVFMVNSSQTHAMMAVPGRERGTPFTTDAGGNFRFTNAPKVGLINLTAEAQGYAGAQLINQQLKVDAANDFTLEVELGQQIGGVVVDATGKPIAGATINANGLSAKTPQAATTVTETDGTFLFPSLRAGPYQLAVTSTQYAEYRHPMAVTGETELKIVMATRGTAHLQVLAANGQPVKVYKLSLKRHFENNPLGIANVLDWPDRSINPSDYRDGGGAFATVKGLPAGEFRFQITDNAHAKTLSPPFKIVEGGAPVEVVATLTLGGALTGTVIDDRGNPVANATISTDMNGGIAADSGLMEIFKTMMPEKHSKVTGKTDAQGRFRITKLAFADYMVRAVHADYCEGTAINLKLESEGQVLDVGVIQLVQGAIVEGTTMISGQPAGQVKVTMSVPFTAANVPSVNDPNAALQPGPAKIMFNASVQSDSNGQFRLLKRVPPGTYRISASRPTQGNDMFTPMLDGKESGRDITITPGQTIVQVNFDLPRR